MRQVIAKRLTESKFTIPHSYMSRVIDVTKLLQFKKTIASTGTKVSMNDFFVKLVAATLKQVPSVNVLWDNQNSMVLENKSIDISVAVAIEGGLLTPIIFEAHSKSLFTISEEIKKLSELAKCGKLDPSQYQGGTFTISNLGMFLPPFPQSSLSSRKWG
eukprot:TRINITY_DN2380_c0_g2_i9.p1 TRINITY_DN2380_c0_g2~~TRINITY_DN2380_c0_g2_i9.p1  ORF type:complete len:159 (-),score=35.23 TRINITY_DN2380_c0_g2_i9:100-576(-)